MDPQLFGQIASIKTAESRLLDVLQPDLTSNILINPATLKDEHAARPSSPL